MDISVLLATRNRGPILQETLSTFAALDAAGVAWELIAIDNGSTDDTQVILSRMASRVPLVALHEPHAGKNRALNRGLEIAKGHLLLFTDDDVLADRGWLQAHLRAARNWPAASIFAGRIVPHFPAGTPLHLQQHEPIRSLLCSFDLPQAEGVTPLLPLGPNFSVRARAMAGMRYEDGIGPLEGRNYAMGSETELLKRLSDRGEKIVYVPSAAVEHVVQPHQIELDWLLGRSFRLGRGLTRMGFIYTDPGARILGAPTYLWRELARSQVRYALSRFLSWPRSFDIACDHRRLQGAIHEHRLMSRERAGLPERRVLA